MGAHLELAVMRENPRYWLYVTITGKMVEFLNLSQLQHPVSSYANLMSTWSPQDHCKLWSSPRKCMITDYTFASHPCVTLCPYDIQAQDSVLQIEFGTSLDLAPYMTDRRSPPVNYELYGVLVHQGFSVHSGHYFAYVKAPNGLWYQMNDEHVSQVNTLFSLLSMLLVTLSTMTIRYSNRPWFPVLQGSLLRYQTPSNSFCYTLSPPDLFV